jgi:uncharacterized protein YjdB
MSTDLWSAVTDVNFGTLKKRHGTILAITDSEYDALLEMAGLNNSLKDETTKTVAAKTVTLNKKSATLGVGEKLNLTATVKPANATSKKVTYTSKNTKIATVNSKGVVTAKKAGTTTITVKTANGKTATCKITVKKAPKSVSLSKKKITLKKGQTIKLKTTITKGSATTLTFKSSNKKVVTVTASGKIKALKKGTATITVITHNNKKVKCKVTVK